MDYQADLVLQMTYAEQARCSQPGDDALIDN
jgi:hypothetical protein